jgi:hypothetical protein
VVYMGTIVGGRGEWARGLRAFTRIRMCLYGAVFQFE